MVQRSFIDNLTEWHMLQLNLTTEMILISIYLQTT